MEKKIKLQLPSPQNYIILDIPIPFGKRQDGFMQNVEKPSIAIEDLSESEAEQYAEELKQRFLSNYKYKKSNKPKSLINELLNKKH